MQKTGVVFWVVFMLVNPCGAQDEEDTHKPFERKRKWFGAVSAGTCQGGHKQAGYYDGTHSRFTFYQLYSHSTVKNDIDYTLGYTTYLGEFPAIMRYQWSLNTSAGIVYYPSYTFAVFTRASFNRCSATGQFTLYATNPANPFGEPIIFNQEMRGTESRMLINSGIRLEGEPLYYGEINPFLEVGITGGLVKPIRNEAIVAGKRYNLFSYDPNLSTDTRSVFVYGGGITTGLITWTRKGPGAELGLFCNILNIKLLDSTPVSIIYGMYLGVLL